MISIVVPNVFMPQYVIESGFDRHEAGFLLTTLSAAGMIGRLSAGAIIDHMGISTLTLLVSMKYCFTKNLNV